MNFGGSIMALKSGKLHVWKKIYVGNIDVGLIIFIWYALGPGTPLSILERRQSMF